MAIVLNRIKEIRDIENLSLKEVSTASGVSESQISRIEKGESLPNHATMLKLCKGLDKEMNEVFETNWKIVNFV